MKIAVLQFYKIWYNIPYNTRDLILWSSPIQQTPVSTVGEACSTQTTYISTIIKTINVKEVAHGKYN